MADNSRAELARLHGIAELMLLEQRLRQAPSVVELGFRLVNDVKHLCATSAAVLWIEGPRHGRLESVAGLPEPVRDAPFTQWMVRACSYIARRLSTQETDDPEAGVREIFADDLPGSLRPDWAEFLPSNGLWVPLRAPDGELLGGMLLARSAPWLAPEKRVLARTGGTAAHALKLLILKRRPGLLKRRFKGRFVFWGIVIAAAGTLLLPVPLTVLASAEVTPDEPFVVRAPLDGVIKEVAVRANQTLEAGAVLVSLDDTDLQARLGTTLQDLEIARAEYRQAQQTSMRDREASSRMAVLAARIAQANAEVEYVRHLLQRIEVRADRAGIAIIPDRQALVGKPVRIGERLMTIADPRLIRVEAWLPVSDAVPLPEAAEAELFLNVSAGEPLPASLRSVDYRAQLSPGGVLAFRVTAVFPEGAEAPRIGQRGTLKLYGEQVPLFRFLFRRPWAALRPWIGL